MGLKRWLAQLDRRAQGSFASFVLLDGTTFYYNAASLTLIQHWIACATAGHPDNWPEPPEAVRAVAKAKDPEAALESICGGGPEWIPYDREALVTEREIRPVSLVAGLDVYDQEDVPDLSEPSESRKDSS